MANNKLAARVPRAGNPLIDERRVTFVWKGKTAPTLIDDLHGWEVSPLPMKRKGKGIWAVSFELPQDAYLEYAFYDPKTKRRLVDRRNAQRVWNGIANYNYYFYMPLAGPTPLAMRSDKAAPSKVSHHRIEISWTGTGKARDVYLYQPNTNKPVPLLIVFDGVDYLKRGKLATIVDNLIAEKRIKPVALALIQNGGPARFAEYACSETTLGLLLYRILPLAEEHLNLLDIRKHPGAHGVMGASMGGLMSLYTGLRLPQIFGHVLSQSGAFWLGEGKGLVPEYATAAVELAKHLPHRKLKIWIDTGRFEWLLKLNRRMRNVLQAAGYQVGYHEFSGGHNYTAWRDDVWQGLEFLFPFSPYRGT